MKIKDRILKIISSEGLTSSAFADTIGVQRSSISHIISGRNKPSLDFLQKTLANYPKYKAEWLIMGKGDIYIQPTQSNLYNSENEPIDPLSPTLSTINELNSIEDINAFSKEAEVEQIKLDNKASIVNDENKVIYNTLHNSIKTKSVEKIVIFYSDKTFVSYNPGELES